MPLTIPPFAAYQAPLIPIAARWRTPPVEGDKFVPCEIDWGVTVAAGLAVQFALNAGPVEFTQIVAVSVDNGRNGSNVSFIFPDTGKQLTIPAYAQGVYPIFSNAMTFYVESTSAVSGDVTVFEILNSMPPPVSVLPSQAQNNATSTGIAIGTNGTSQIVPTSVIAGTLNAITIDVSAQAGATAQTAVVTLQDGLGHVLWSTGINVAANGALDQAYSLSGLSVRFFNGLAIVIGSSTISGGGFVSANVYYSVP